MTVEEAIFCEKSYIGETNCIDCKYYGTDTCQSRESHRMAIKALEQTKWIPVSERLPEKNMECLVTVGDFNFVQTAMYSNLMRLIDHRIFYQGECGDETFKDITWYVKAWMPLPQPYKTESEE